MGKIYGRKKDDLLNDKSNEIAQNDNTSKISIDSDLQKDNLDFLDCSNALLSKKRNNFKYNQTFQYDIKRLAVLMLGFVFIF